MLLSLAVKSQENTYHRSTDKFRLESYVIASGAVATSTGSFNPSLLNEFNFAYKEHYFQLFARNYFDNNPDLFDTDYYTLFSLSYGRDFLKGDKWALRGFAGLGNTTSERDSETHIRLNAQFNYHVSPTLAVGFNTAAAVSTQRVLPDVGVNFSYRPRTVAEKKQKVIKHDSLIKTDKVYKEKQIPRYERNAFTFRRLGFNMGFGFVDFRSKYDRNRTPRNAGDDESSSRDSGYLNFSLDVTVGYGKHLLMWQPGANITFSDDSNTYSDLVYGRVFPISRTIVYEAYAGLTHSIYYDSRLGNTLGGAIHSQFMAEFNWFHIGLTARASLDPYAFSAAGMFKVGFRF